MFEVDQTSLAEEIVGRLIARKARVFARLERTQVRALVDAALAALVEDIAAGEREAVRAMIAGLITTLSARSLSFADLRFFALTLRAAVTEALGPGPELRARVEGWLFEAVLVSAMQFIINREDMLQARSVELEVHQLERQLTELQLALTDKTQLLELIREASTPIVPVVRGILVVPLIGIFDTVRAEHLTERLLSEVVRSHARTALLDVSGVPVFDTAAAELIIRLTRSVRLLGTTIILVGMSPESAQTLVQLGIDLGDLETRATLQDGLARALRLQGMAIQSS